MQINLDKSLWHHNFTLRKILYFSITAGIGAGVTWLLTWLFTEMAGWWYMLSVGIASIIAIGIKFVVTAIWVFK